MKHNKLLLYKISLIVGIMPFFQTGSLNAQQLNDLIPDNQRKQSSRTKNNIEGDYSVNMNDSVGVINISDMGTTSILEMLENYTDKAVLRQQNLPEVKITFRSRHEMTREEAILAISSLLSLNGIALTNVGEKYIKAVPAPNINAQVPKLLGDDINGIKPSQEIYAKFYKLTYLNVTEALPLIQPMLSQGAPILFEKTNSFMVTDALVNLQRLDEILDKIDKPTEMDQKILYYPLKHVAASEISKRLEVMKANSLRRYLENNTTIDSDDRTNQLIIITHPSNEKLIEDLITKLDVDVAPLTRTEIFHIKHADAAEVTTLIEQIISGQQKVRDDSRGRSGSRTRTTTNQQNQTRQPPQQRSTTTTSTSNAIINAAKSAAKSLQFSDFLTIVADPRGNSVLASGTPSDLNFLKELINKIDTLLAQVRIEVIIAEVNLDKGQASGLSQFGINFNSTTGSNGSNTIGGGEINYSVSSAGTSQIASPFSLSGSIKDFSLAAVIDTARSDQNVKVLSSPTILTTHNQEATINVTESRPVITSTQSDNSNLSSTRTNVQFRDIGLELKVKPLIGSNGVIQLEIDQKVENIIDFVDVDENPQPVIGKRQTTSFISVKDNELIVLGGLQTSNVSLVKGRLAFFGRIPILGPLLGSKVDEDSKRELIIFIKPKIIRTTDDANMDAIETIENSKSKDLVNNFIEKGNFDEVVEEDKKKDKKKSKNKKNKNSLLPFNWRWNNDEN